MPPLSPSPACATKGCRGRGAKGNSPDPTPRQGAFRPAQPVPQKSAGRLDKQRTKQQGPFRQACKLPQKSADRLDKQRKGTTKGPFALLARCHKRLARDAKAPSLTSKERNKRRDRLSSRSSGVTKGRRGKPSLDKRRTRQRLSPCLSGATKV